MLWFGKKVDVTFIDYTTGKVTGTTRVAATDLPETFAIKTTMYIGDKEWHVVSADPETRAQFQRSGKLTLRLRRLRCIDPKEILFSVPSICDTIPPLGDEPSSAEDCILDEDDWRQFELISRQFAAAADEEIEAIRRVHDESAESLGWRSVAVRKQPEPPVATDITLPEVDRAFGRSLRFAGVTYRGSDKRILSGYSFTAPDGLRCYGVLNGDRASVLAVHRADLAPTSPSIECLAAIARGHDLDLVDWCRCARAAHDDPLFRQLLSMEPDAPSDRGGA